MRKKLPVKIPLESSFTFSRFIGNTLLCKLLSRSLARERLSHSYLFTGPEHVGKSTLSRLFAFQLLHGEQFELPWKIIPSEQLQRHPDFSSLDTSEQRGIDDLRDFAAKAMQAPVHGKYRVLLIYEIDRISEAAMNALLKVFEDTPKRTIFISTSSHPDQLLPTIRSRCQILQLSPIPRKVLESELVESADTIDQHSLEYGMGLPGLIANYQNQPELLEALQQRDADLKALRGASRVEKHAYSTSLLKNVKDFSERQNLVREVIATLQHHEFQRLKNESPKIVQSQDTRRLQQIKKSIRAQRRLRQNVHPGLLLEDLLLTYV